MFQNDMTLTELGATCETCLFWRDQQCRVQAPSPTPVLASSPTARWPVTRAEDGCGRHPAVQVYLAGLTRVAGEVLETEEATHTGDATTPLPAIVPKPGKAAARAKESR
jgi:hypothetical protein